MAPCFIHDGDHIIDRLVERPWPGEPVAETDTAGGTLEIRDGATRRKEVVSLNAEQVRDLLKLAVGTRWHLPMNLMARLGLRPV